MKMAARAEGIYSERWGLKMGGLLNSNRVDRTEGSQRGRVRGSADTWDAVGPKTKVRRGSIDQPQVRCLIVFC
jgi:hypothetical protein